MSSRPVLLCMMMETSVLGERTLAYWGDILDYSFEPDWNSGGEAPLFSRPVSCFGHYKVC